DPPILAVHEGRVLDLIDVEVRNADVGDDAPDGHERPLHRQRTRSVVERDQIAEGSVGLPSPEVPVAAAPACAAGGSAVGGEDGRALGVEGYHDGGRETRSSGVRDAREALTGRGIPEAELVRLPEPIDPRN